MDTWTAPIATALRFINEKHDGYLGFVTADGLVFRNDLMVGYHLGCDDAVADNDRLAEEFEVFPITDGMIDFRALRAHMGY